MKAKIKFIGACGTVTGSKTLFEVDDLKVLIDCGLFQGSKTLRLENWSIFPYSGQIDAVVLTHAHIDHSGYLPKLVKEGFKGKIYCSHATADLCKIMLLDAAHLQEEDSEFANETGHSRHKPAMPLYTVADAEKCLEFLQPVADEEWHALSPNLSFKMIRSGHILGSRFIHLNVSDSYKSKYITFSGDIGNGRSTVIKGASTVPYSDIVIIESTYGDRIQEKTDPKIDLKKHINAAIEREGVVVIPAFSVGRTQELIHLIAQLKEAGEIGEIKIYVDSPMSLKVTDLYLRYKDELLLEIDERNVELPLSISSFEGIRSPDESMLLTMQDGPFIVISAAGMLNGGRVLHHLKKRLPDERNTILFVGYQATETKGRLLQSGIDKLRIHHEEIPVNANIETIASMSAHADQADLVNWLKEFSPAPKKVFINHGETQAAQALQEKLRDSLGIDAIIAEPDLEFEIF